MCVYFGLRFIVPHTESEGCLICDNPTWDYPTLVINLIAIVGSSNGGVVRWGRKGDDN